MQAQTRARLALIRATEEALDRRPDLTMAFLRSRMERAASRRTDDPLVKRVGTGLTLRAFDVRPAVGERMVRLWLRRAKEREKQALDFGDLGTTRARGVASAVTTKVRRVGE